MEKIVSRACNRREWSCGLSAIGGRAWVRLMSREKLAIAKIHLHRGSRGAPNLMNKKNVNALRMTLMTTAAEVPEIIANLHSPLVGERLWSPSVTHAPPQQTLGYGSSP